MQNQEKAQKLAKRNVVWKPNPGSQSDFLSCPFFEVLYHGTRGPGKSDALLMSFIKHIGKYGEAWRGIIFRRTEHELVEIQNKAEKWFNMIFGKRANYKKQNMIWEWDTGEKLYFRRIMKPSEYWIYHGHEYPFIGWEELTNWSMPDCYLAMISCCRCSTPGVPRMIRATTNPYGPGHSWVKDRFELSGKYWETKILDITDKTGLLDEKEKKSAPWFKRVAIHGHLAENKILMEHNPKYAAMIVQSATNPEMAKAWLEGSWNIVAGGMFSDVWKPEFNIVEPFLIPPTWKVNRTFDWGSSAPFSVGWWAESDGSDYQDLEGKYHPTIRGDLFRILEWYGAVPNRKNTGLHLLTKEICSGILEREKSLRLLQKIRPGPADSSIFDTIDGRSIGDDMARLGVRWEKANKSPGSRKQGWQQIREMLANAHRKDGKPREYPGMFIFPNCQDFIRLMPILPRDEKDPDDIDSKLEDHIADETRYRVHHPKQTIETSKIEGFL